ncbi:MAG: phage baseplate assembly protein W [Flavobacteriales bacterium]|jgi:phage baseplate assembly protein W
MNYYTMPIKLGEITKGKHLSGQVDIRESIHQNINLILRTFTLSYRFDPSFGCVMNKYQAATPPQNIPERMWREKMREDIQNNLKDMLQRYETRINVKDVFIDMRKPSRGDKAIVNVRVQIIGNMTLGRREKFNYPDSEVSEEAMEVLPLMIPVGKLNS